MHDAADALESLSRGVDLNPILHDVGWSGS